MQADIVILGAGTAGSVAALNLAPLRRVVVVDRCEEPAPRIGESLPGAARRLLTDMRLLTDFLADGHLPQQVLRSSWGAPSPMERDGLANPDGHGWVLDRSRFERRLRDAAVTRGACLVAPARIQRLTRSDAGWRVAYDANGVSSEVEATIVIDATGRSSRLLAEHGVVRHVSDRLICTWLRHSEQVFPPGVIQVEAEDDGWWYATNLPDGAVIAFHTDSDLDAARRGRSHEGLLRSAKRLPMISACLPDTGWTHSERNFCAAHTCWLEQPAGDGWIAAGDAAMAFDPLSSQGLFNALYFGLAAAEAADRLLHGEASVTQDYAEESRAVLATYARHRAAWYALERRWPDRAFWQRRLAISTSRHDSRQDSCQASHQESRQETG